MAIDGMDELRKIYTETKTIAVAGASADPSKAVHTIPAFLQRQGYRIIPVNPKGRELFGKRVFSNTPSAAEMQVSNDGGFTGAPWQTYRSALDWSLADPGNRIVTLLVYARLCDAGDNLLCGGVSLTDDIIYDPLPPTLLSVTVDTTAVFALSEQGQPSVNLRLTAEVPSSDPMQTCRCYNHCRRFAVHYRQGRGSGAGI